MGLNGLCIGIQGESVMGSIIFYHEKSMGNICIYIHTYIHTYIYIYIYI